MTTDIILVIQTVILFLGLQSLRHMRKQEAIQSYTALSDRLFQQNLAELKEPVLFESLDLKGSEIPEGEVKRKLKHYLFMQFTMYEQMFCLHESCKDNIQAMRPWNKRFLSIIKKERMREYWTQDYSKQSCDEFKKFVECCLEAKSEEELNDFFNKRKRKTISQYFAKYCPFSSTCNG